MNHTSVLCTEKYTFICRKPLAFFHNWIVLQWDKQQALLCSRIAFNSKKKIFFARSKTFVWITKNSGLKTKWKQICGQMSKNSTYPELVLIQCYSIPWWTLHFNHFMTVELFANAEISKRKRAWWLNWYVSIINLCALFNRALSFAHCDSLKLNQINTNAYF